jgi:hypothetical protein
MILRGRVSKWVTNGSKTAVMDVMCFLGVSVFRRTVQLHDSLGSRRACVCSEADFSSQNGDRAWMCTTEEQRFVVCFLFLWTKGLNTKDIHKEIFPVYGWKCILCKAVHVLARKSPSTLESRRWCPARCGNGWDNSQKDFCAAGVDALVKRWDKCISVGGGYVEKQMFFPGSNITCFTFYIPVSPVYRLYEPC